MRKGLSTISNEVRRVFDELTIMLEVETYKSLFHMILTDDGSGFQSPLSLSFTICEEIRTKIYYCNPHSSWQKGMIDKDHEFIRFFVPKGRQFDKYTQN